MPEAQTNARPDCLQAQIASFGQGVLSGVHVLEFSAIGPVPWGVGLLADMGAEIVRICNPGSDKRVRLPADMSERGRKNVYLDLKDPQDLVEARRLIVEADVLVEGMRPGVMERLTLGPEDCAALNPRLVYARVTGWGQTGPLAEAAGHDINYISLSGALHAMGHAGGPPCLPLNLVGDYGGGGAFLVIGVLGALLKVRSTGGPGMCVDISMLDGAVRQMGTIYERYYRGEWRDERESNLLDGGTPWYRVYRTRDGGYMAVGAIEPKFYEAFVKGLGLDVSVLPERSLFENQIELQQIFTDRFLTRTREEWAAIFDNVDACVTPVLSLAEAPVHPHNLDRGVFVPTPERSFRAGVTPRFSQISSTQVMES